MKIITNHHPRDFVDGSELNAREREQFDYIDWEGVDAGTESATFVRYKGDLIDLGEFLVDAPEGWDGVRADSYFSALVIRIVEDGERGVVGLALS